ncbi:MAG: hypothetical protein KJO39_05155 [Bacteroidia bacterium]|nr:hypothetical protein [Bacteroidia bacterium]NNF31436.1 hypothetical protein [Flavobacteriaceae bacterium]NNK54015.1 hypothetical protein [Flavobacteriaceae bacterium]NNM07592.1 hypothetical protein [Flavobacteriaceae bacterium]
MKRFILLLPVLLCSFLLFSFSSEEIKDKKETLFHDGYLRTYYVHLP